MKPPIRVLVVAVAMGLVTALIGWWMVPVAGAVWGFVASRDTWPATTAAAGAGLAWAALLGWAAVRGPIFAVAGKVGAIMAVSGAGLVAIALLFPMLLAGSSAVLMGSVKQKK
jgi:hypothetical protein